MLKQENIFAKIISYLFHPLLLPTMGLLLIFHLNDASLFFSSTNMQLFLYALTFLSTFLLPALSAVILLRLKLISSLAMETKEERRLPYLATAIFYSVESYLLRRWNVSFLAMVLMFGATLLVVSVLVINIFWKISAHMAGIGALCGMMLAVSSRLQINLHTHLIFLFLIAGLIGFSRLRLNSHNPAQVYVGFLLGVATQLILFL